MGQKFTLQFDDDIKKDQQVIESAEKVTDDSKPIINTVNNNFSRPESVQSAKPQKPAENINPGIGIPVHTPREKEVQVSPATAYQVGILIIGIPIIIALIICGLVFSKNNVAADTSKKNTHSTSSQNKNSTTK